MLSRLIKLSLVSMGDNHEHYPYLRNHFPRTECDLQPASQWLKYTQTLESVFLVYQLTDYLEGTLRTIISRIAQIIDETHRGDLIQCSFSSDQYFCF